jgi:hypothetical protein
VLQHSDTIVGLFRGPSNHFDKAAMEGLVRETVSAIALPDDALLPPVARERLGNFITRRE